MSLMVRNVFLFGLAAFIMISLYLYWSVDSDRELYDAAINRQHGSGSAGLVEEQVDDVKSSLMKLRQRVEQNDVLIDRLKEKVHRVGARAGLEDDKDTKLGSKEAKSEDEDGKLKKVAHLQPQLQAPAVAVTPSPPVVVRDKTAKSEQVYRGNKVEAVFNLKNRLEKVVIATPDYQTPTMGAVNFTHGKLVCPADASQIQHNATSDVHMLDVYELLPFDNPDGGVWKQGWELHYEAERVQQEPPLEVVVIPHSHNDPGWIKTFEQYFADQTKNILDKMVVQLGEKHDMSFIYAEMSFFELWWSRASAEQRTAVGELLKSGQLEIVTGGWVMTDEANAHYYSIVMQLFEGHEFLLNQLGYRPTSHWAIDPFGLSPTVAYILQRAGLTHMAVQRVHYSVKKHLASVRRLEFQWRQLWAGSSPATDIRTHLFPFYSYDAPHSCGPDPKVCCQFDFRRLNAIGCPWGTQPVRIDADNVAERAQALADQYRKKAQLYAHNVLLVPLGDDFRYDEDFEWEEQHGNYQRLMHHINANKELNMKVRFGTLKDYFQRLDTRLIDGGGQQEANKNAKAQQLPTLSGDFFTYADRDDHYWSGYFTSRPFYKRLDRILQHYVRSADILFTLLVAKDYTDAATKQLLGSLYNKLVDSRRELSLFQHHDAVVGTARRLVMFDYGKKMIAAIDNCKEIISRGAQLFMTPSPTSAESPKPTEPDDKPALVIDERHSNGKLPMRGVIDVGATVVLFNSLPYPREEVHCIHVTSWKSRVSKRMAPTNEGGNGKGTVASEEVPQQLAPVIDTAEGDGALQVIAGRYELCFLATLPAWGFSRFDVLESPEGGRLVKLRQSRDGLIVPDATGGAKFDVGIAGGDNGADGGHFELSNELIKAKFDSRTAQLRSVTKLEEGSGGDKELAVELSFIRYGARAHNPLRRGGGDSLSGAYLFLPDGPAKPLEPSPSTGRNNNIASYIVVDGPVRKSVHVQWMGGSASEIRLGHWVGLDVNARHLSVQNTVDLSPSGEEGDRQGRGGPIDVEVGMRLSVPAFTRAGDALYTDLNGFQMIRRRRFPGKLPLQAHFYPMPGAMFLESSGWRLSLLGAQALGVGSNEAGVVDVMFDRRFSSDDDRGLAEPMMDNRRTRSTFRLLPELLTTSATESAQGKEKEANATPIAFHSLPAHHISLQLHYPLMTLHDQANRPVSKDMLSSYSALRTPFPCDMHAVALRTLSEPTVYGEDGSRSTPYKRVAALVLHRFGVECRQDTPLQTHCSVSSLRPGSLNVKELFDESAVKTKYAAGNVSLTLLREDGGSTGEPTLEPMELKTVKLVFA